MTAHAEVRPYRLQLVRPLRTAQGELSAREGFVVRIGDAAGEAAPLPHLGTESLEECGRALSAAVARLGAVTPPSGRELPADWRAILERLPPAARCGLEQALLDVVARARGVPLCELLRAGAPRRVRVSALLGSDGGPELAREARERVDEGFTTLKLKVGLEDDLPRAAAVRDAVGPAIRLRLDANGAWDARAALQRLRALAPLGIELCEQPTPDLAGLEDSPIPIAADEQVASDPEGALARARFLVLKPMLLGGLLPALRLAERARALGLGCFATTSLEGAIGRAGAAHLAAALVAEARPDRPQPDAGLATGRLLATDLCPDPLVPRTGGIALSARPGLGLW